ncbi:MAG: cob(I)yrinic acid a,c-diamide adenosyltransferase [Proteobacteria bacterium]|jgi:cob(I)alamin adenosyltransferase|nr:cob(I)yrinic acid a,c-diamide adenosyltransferase [Pseudomonadota bacterium]MBU1903474.1 cob(I)yrinic acid a,c-diamide adenosyltransferase [Pseudomonadota bacterium]
MKGYIQVYTGNGKGKTAAAFGLALRAAGAGLRVYIAQFVKGTKYSGLKAVERLSDAITLRQYGFGFFLNREPDEEDIRAAREGLKEVREMMCSGRYDLVILDEANIAAYYGLFSVEDLLNFIHAKPEEVELVLTGRMADPRIIEAADLVTEMREVKHYCYKGIEAGIGIEK